MRYVNKTSVTIGPDVLTACDTVVDVRSPAEYAEDHIPGAINAPVLDDEERARVGTMYKRASPFEAKKLGAALVAKNIAEHLETCFAAMPKGWRPLVYCWRGGKRSGALAHILREIGWDAKILEGGYKSYRRHVVDALSEVPLRFRFRVVHGATGCGKSRLLRALARADAQVLDLEDLAAHRGSVLGGLPERDQPSQKMFESQLLRVLEALDPTRLVWVEGESRKIGQVQIPEALIETMRAAECLLLEADTAVRVRLLTDEYRHFFDDRGALDAQLDCLAPLHGKGVIEEWKALAAGGDWDALVARLLAEHYDPAYLRSAGRNFTRLPDAQAVRVEAAGTAAFETLAKALVAHDTAVTTA